MSIALPSSFGEYVMHKIIIEEPYEFIPPETGTFWSTVIQHWNLHASWLKRAEGVVEHEIRYPERLKASIDSGAGIMLAPNHSRYADPIVMGWVAREVRCHFYAMASWHLFHQGWFSAWAIRKMGGFSVYREGVDRKAIDKAIEVLVEAKRPLIIFPEGAVSRTTDRLHALLDGVAFIARTAAKKRAKVDPDKKVVVHPVALKYLYQGDIEKTAHEVLDSIEQRFTWRSHDSMTLMQRIARVGDGLLALKEIEVFGGPQTGGLHERLEQLIDGLLHPIEEEWIGSKGSGSVVPRVKAIRMKMMPEMVRGEIDEDERQRRWRQLADLYLAQQVSCYPADYLVELFSVDRVLETLERFEEDINGKPTVHGQLKVVIEIGEAIEVSPKRDRKAPADVLMEQIREQLQTRMEALAKESKLIS